MAARNPHVLPLAALAALVALASCRPLEPSYGRRRSGAGDVILEQTPPAAPAPATTPEGPTFTGGKNLKIKRAGLLAQDLEAALGLAGTELCAEGELSCLGDVHKIALGGIAPYDRGVFRGWEEAPATAPLALERVVAAGCKARVTRDAERPAEALLWRGKVDAAFVADAYRRLLWREPTAAETAAALALAPEMAPDEWAWAVCFAVGTSVEALFY